MVVQAAREVDHIAADDEVADLDGLVCRRVAGREEQEDRAVAEEVVIAVDQFDRPVAAGVITREVEVPLDGVLVVPGCPLGALDDDGHCFGNER